MKKIEEVNNVELAYAEARRVEQAIDRQLVLLLGSGASGEIHLRIPKVQIESRVVLLLIEGRYAEAGWNVRTTGGDSIYLS